MVLETILNTATIFGFLGGVVATATVTYRYVASHISVGEAQTIYTKLKDVVEEYETAKADGMITTDEQLRIADDAMAAVQEILKSLKD